MPAYSYIYVWVLKCILQKTRNTRIEFYTNSIRKSNAHFSSARVLYHFHKPRGKNSPLNCTEIRKRRDGVWYPCKKKIVKKTLKIAWFKAVIGECNKIKINLKNNFKRPLKTKKSHWWSPFLPQVNICGGKGQKYYFLHPFKRK